MTPKLFSKMLVVAVYTLLASVTPLFASEGFGPLSKYINENKKIIGLPSGTAVAVIKDNKIIYEGYFGYADIESKQLVNEDTVFYIASMTKPFFALTTLLQEHQGEISESTSMAELFPGAKFKGFEPEKVNVRHLLTHTSGLDNHPLVLATAYTGIHDSSLRKTLVENTHPHKTVKLNQFEYTNVGYNILSVWFEEEFQQSWQKTLHQSVLKPLKMSKTSTFVSDVEKYSWQMARGYSVKSEQSQQAVYLQKKDNTMQAAGGMISTAQDLSRFIIMQLNGGRVEGQQIFPNKVIKKSQQPQTEFQRYGEKQAYAWGWFQRSLFEHTLLVHRGGFSGANTYMSFMPKEKVGLVVLSNQDKWGGDLAFAIEDYVYAKLLGKPNNELQKILVDNKNKVVERVKEFKRKSRENFPGSGTETLLLTLDNKRYTGVYRHRLLGEIEVRLNSEKLLEVEWGNMISLVSFSEKKDNLNVEFVPNTKKTLRFGIKDSTIKSLTYDGFEFIKE